MKARYHGADMSKPAEIARHGRRQPRRRFGAVDILVNNAGIQHVAPIDEFPDGALGRDHRDQPLVGFPLPRGGAAGHEEAQVGAHHQHRLGPRAGRLAQQERLRRRPSTASSASPRRWRSKSAEDGITRERHLPGLRAHPAGAEADRGPRARSAASRKSAPRRTSSSRPQPTKEFVTIEQIAAMALYLAGDAAAQINGATFSIDGGWTAR